MNCSKCNDPIHPDEPKIYAEGVYFHTAHFTCDECGKEIGTGPYKMIQNKFFCSNDFLSLFAPLCGHCHALIKNYGISIANSYFHLNHLICKTCERPLLSYDGSKSEKIIKEFLLRNCTFWNDNFYHNDSFTSADNN